VTLIYETTIAGVPLTCTIEVDPAQEALGDDPAYPAVYTCTKITTPVAYVSLLELFDPKLVYFIEQQAKESIES
jgi:hypothetical protein